MECNKIRELLSEYMDDTLDVQKKALVEEHIATCHSCQEELTSIKALVQELGSMDSVRPPEDFLTHVHARLGGRSEILKKIRRLFLPLRSKLALQFAAAATITLIVFTIFHIMEPTKEMFDMSSKPRHTEIAKDFGRDSMKALPKEDTHKAKTDIKESAVPKSNSEKKFIELVLVMKRQMPTTASFEGTKGESRKFTGKSRALQDKEGDMTYDIEEQMNEQRESPALSKKRNHKEAKRAEELKEEIPFAEKQADFPFPLEDETLAKIKNLITHVKGKIISLKYDKQTGQPQYLTVEMSFQKFSLFLERLGRFGTIQSPPSKIQENDHNLVQIKIRFIRAE